MLGMAMMMSSGMSRHYITIAANRGHWRKSVDAPTIPSGTPIILTITINSNIEVQSTDAQYGSIHLDAICPGSQVFIVNNGYLLGMGGEGGSGGMWEDVPYDGGPGYPGGAGIRADFSGLLTITNGSGYIWGGGGGGGGADATDTGPYSGDGGSGGGGGAGGGLGGNGGSSSNGSPGTAGGNGTTGRYGVPGSAGGTAGQGGGYGSAGITSGDGRAGGATGYAVKHNAGTTIAWISGSGRTLGGVGT